MSHTAANTRARGYKTYRRGEVVGFVAALDRLAVRQIIDRNLSEEERIGIADLRRAGVSIRRIAVTLGRAPSRYRGSCAATAAATVSTGRSRRTAGRSSAEPVAASGESTRTRPCAI